MRLEIGAVDSVRTHQRGGAEQQRVAFDVPAHASARAGFEVAGRPQGQSAAARLGNDGVGERMFAAGIEAGSEPEHAGCVEGTGGHHFAEDRATFGQGAGLVDHEGVDPAQAFNRLGIAEQHAALRRTTGGDHHRHRRG